MTPRAKTSEGPRHPGPLLAAPLLMGLALLPFLLALGLASNPLPLRAQGESACAARVGRDVAPQRLPRGEHVDITMTVQADCSAVETPLHVVFVLDSSGSMAGEPLAQMQEAVWRVVGALEGRAATRTGLVAYNDEVTQRCPLREDPDEVRRCLNDVRPQGGTDLAAAIIAGINTFTEGRRDVSSPEHLREVMVLLSDGANASGCEPVQRAAGQASGQGILVMTVGVGDVADRDCMRSAASSPRYYFEAETDDLVAVFQLVLRQLDSVLLRYLRIEDQLPPELRYVPGSGRPAPIEEGADGRLVWNYNFIPADGLTVSLRAEALAEGEQPSSLGARVTFRDTTGAEGAADFPIQTIVVEPGAPPIALPETRAAIALERAAMDVGERSGGTLELVIDLPEPSGETHLMLALDASGSMAGESNALMKEALVEMLDRLEPEVGAGFRGGLLQFNSMATVLCDLLLPDAGFPRLRSCVNRVGATGGTGIGAGLRAAHQALREARPAPGQEDVVLFTDGANNAGCADVQAAAEGLKAEGVVLHTVCLGSACDKDCMRSAATSPAHYYEIEEAGGLEAAFLDVAGELLSTREVARLALRLRLPPSLALDPASPSLAPDEIDADGALWRVERLPSPGLRIDFTVEAVAAGEGAPSLEAEVDFANGGRALREANAPPLPVQDPGAPTTPPPGPSSTPSPSAPFTPTSSPTATPARLFLPLLLAETCVAAPPIDLAIVLDASLSMAERGPEGATKREAAAEAIELLLESQAPGRDRAALVAFDGAARTLAGVDAPHDALRAALAGLTLGQGTAIGAGLDEARALLLAAREGAGAGEAAASRRQAILLLTDGRPFPEAPERARQAARSAKDAGIEVFAIGLGDAVDARLLAEIASRQEELRLAEGRAALLRAARWLERRLRCGVDTWSGRELDAGRGG